MYHTNKMINKCIKAKFIAFKYIYINTIRELKRPYEK